MIFQGNLISCNKKNMTNYSESEIIPFALKIIKDNSSGIDTQNLIKLLRKNMSPEGEDTIILANRSDDRFSQKVRNLRSHKTLEKKKFVKVIENKFVITDEGLKYLENTSNLLNNIINFKNNNVIAIQDEIKFDDLVNNILNTLTPKEENVIRRRYGIGKKFSETLQTIGDSFSITRERVRQIESKSLRKLKHPSRSKMIKSILIKIEEIINKTIIMTETEFLKRLKKNNIYVDDLYSLKFFLSQFEFTSSLSKIFYIKNKFYFSESNFYFRSLINVIKRYVQKNAKESGIVNIDLLHKEVRRRNFKCSYDFVVEMVKQRNGYLIDDKHFLAKTSVEKNSLISVIHKTLSVTKKIDVEVLSDCIIRSRKTNFISPPSSVLLKICEKLGYQISDNYIENKKYSLNNNVLKGVIKRLVQMFDDNNRVMSYEDIMSQKDQYDLNENSINVYIYQNLFVQPKKMIFALAGTEFDNTEIDFLDDKRKRLLQKFSENTKFSQDKNGSIKVTYPKTMTTNIMYINPDFANLIPEGQYNVTCDDIIGIKKIDIKVFANKIWPLSKLRNNERLKKYNYISLQLDVINNKGFASYE